jgi:hypothetical protein
VDRAKGWREPAEMLSAAGCRAAPICRACQICHGLRRRVVGIISWVVLGLAAGLLAQIC